MVLTVRLQFDGNAMEALTYYAGVFGVSPVESILSDEEVTGSCYPIPGADTTRLLRGSLEIGGAVLVLSDGEGTLDPVVHGLPHLELHFSDEEAMERVFESLASGGSVHREPGESVWSRRTATVIDRYGLTWTLSFD
jgi:uncharacterized glyoxalase superfamily protein PhnB